MHCYDNMLAVRQPAFSVVRTFQPTDSGRTPLRRCFRSGVHSERIKFTVKAVRNRPLCHYNLDFNSFWRFT